MLLTYQDISRHIKTYQDIYTRLTPLNPILQYSDWIGGLNLDVFSLKESKSEVKNTKKCRDHSPPRPWTRIVWFSLLIMPITKRIHINRIQECMKIGLEMIRQAGLTNFWVRKMMAGSKMFYDAKIAHRQSPEWAFFAFCKFFQCF